MSKKTLLYPIIIGVILVPIFFWSVLTESTKVTLQANEGHIELFLNNRKAGECTIPPYTDARLVLMLRQTFQTGESFFQGWANISIKTLPEQYLVFKDTFSISRGKAWTSLRGKWKVNLFGFYTLDQPQESYMNRGQRVSHDKRTDYARSLLTDVRLGNFILNADLYNSSSAGVQLQIERGKRLTALMQLYPGPTLIWTYKGKQIGSTKAEDLSISTDQKLSLWPSKKKIIKNIIGKLSGSCLVAICLIVGYHTLLWIFCVYFRMVSFFYSKGIAENEGD